MENIAKIVKDAMQDSLYKLEEVPDGSPPDGAVVVEGVRHTFAFHPDRLVSHREEIVSVLREMPEPFFKATGGGWTFLNLCADKNGVQWGEQANVNELCVLAIGLGLGKWLLPRDMWAVLPGGMPYVVFDIP